MYIFIGLLIIAIGSIGVSSSYIPINKIKEWSWENFWMVQRHLCMASVPIPWSIACSG